MPGKSNPQLLQRFRGPIGKLRLLEAMREQYLVAGDLRLAKSLISLATLSTLKPNQPLITQGAADNDIYFVLSGAVSVSVNGREIAIRESGDHVGEMALIDSTASRSATVKAKIATVVARVTADKFERLANSHPALWRRIAIAVAARLRERNKFHAPPRSQPAIFVASSSEGLSVATCIYRSLLRRPFVPNLWSEGVFQCSNTTIEDLMRLTRETDFAVIVMTADDSTNSRGRKKASPRDNIVFELGLFMGALAKERTFIVAPIGVDLKIPTDLLGLTLLRFKKQRGHTLAQSLKRVNSELARQIGGKGPL